MILCESTSTASSIEHLGRRCGRATDANWEAVVLGTLRMPSSFGFGPKLLEICLVKEESLVDPSLFTLYNYVF